MLNRWLPTRCWTEDVPALTTASGGVIKFLEEQDPQSSNTETFTAAERADVFTYHFGVGRGVRWQDRPRAVLWLLSFSDTHDAGYQHAEDLQTAGRLYPATDPAWQPAVCTTRPWGDHPDEDAYEWAASIYGALETFEINASAIAAGAANRYPWPLVLQATTDDDLWVFTIGRNVTYMPPTQRDRWLTNAEIEDLFLQITGYPDKDDYEIDNPANPNSWLFADIYSVHGPQSPDAWLRRVSADATSGHRLPLPPT